MTFARSLTLAMLSASATLPATMAAAATQAPAAQAAPAIKLSAKAGKAIIALQTAVTANDVGNITGLVAAAKELASSPDDNYAIAQLQLKAAAGANDNDGAAAAVDAIVASGFAVPPQQIAEIAGAIGGALLREKKYDRAVMMFDRAIAANPANSDYLLLLAETKNAQGKNAEALQTMQKALARASSSGATIPENTYKRAFLLAYGAESPLATQFGRQWLNAYPSADSWRNALAVYRNLNKLDVQATLDLLRLMRATGALNSADDYLLLAQAAADKGNYSEAQSVIADGIAARKVDPKSPMAAETIAGLKSKAKLTAADLAVAAKDAKTGASKLTLANRYYGFGDYAASAEMNRAAIAAGADANLANLHLGMALAQAGDKAGAITALKAVTGVYAPVADYWLLYVAKKA
ncbi:MAG: tetratricopeptide repeat protein [Sphingomicrobium sp.]